MKKTLAVLSVVLFLVIVASASWFLSKTHKESNQIVADNPSVSQNNANLRYANIVYSEKINLAKGKGATKEAAACIECHSQKNTCYCNGLVKKFNGSCRCKLYRLPRR